MKMLCHLSLYLQHNNNNKLQQNNNFVLLFYWCVLCYSVFSSLSQNINDVRPMDWKLCALQALKLPLIAVDLFSKFSGWWLFCKFCGWRLVGNGCCSQLKEFFYSLVLKCTMGLMPCLLLWWFTHVVHVLQRCLNDQLLQNHHFQNIINSLFPLPW